MQRILLTAIAGALWIAVSYSQNMAPPTLSSHSEKPAPSQTAISLPPDFPVFVDTGNPETDQQNYRRAKEDWIKANPERYQQMFRRGKPTEEQLQKRSERENSKP